MINLYPKENRGKTLERRVRPQTPDKKEAPRNPELDQDILVHLSGRGYLKQLPQDRIKKKELNTGKIKYKTTP
ncbi:hypothetical protein C922_05270 [Plasmodium inui San Antonio 1]|uniref:Uncharacterized protein n=1 Tax=Plasmodium inui San Antonio 1 TaxID=1237626 RepID=W7AGB0_9APIC|nr:hypothetical protein C922_05270 [Plasmodium inui San Antonio 1]EUD64351.1 hypothetical protein C922_05270 [Plasmodium inui San Antonio 1]